MMAIIAGASFIIIFGLIASRALLKQRAYQSRVIVEKDKAKKQLQENIKAAQSLTASYQQFIGAPENVLGGNPNGRGDRDGDNAKIILDALPSKYDFPALATSLDKILSNKAYKIGSITGKDDELNQKTNSGGAAPVVVDIPFEIDISGSYPAVQSLISVMERSVRPFHVQKVSFSGNDSLMQLTIGAKTFYQPEKTLTITTKEVR